MIKIGIIGLSPENGHPYSFSAIINGYNHEAIVEAGWGGIANYLAKREPSDFGIGDAQITHVWCDDRAESKRISAACKVENISESLEAMATDVDAVILARDDYANHLDMARVFLDAGLPIFVDKPLTISGDELTYFMPFIQSGQLMSCSGLRYCKELDALRNDPAGTIGNLKAVHCAVVNGWEKYGVHMLDAIWGVYPELEAVSVSKTNGHVDNYAIETQSGVPITVTCLGKTGGVFRMSFFGDAGQFTITVSDNFSAFRRTLEKFVTQIESKQAEIPPTLTQHVLELLIAGNACSSGGEPRPVINLVNQR